MSDKDDKKRELERQRERDMDAEIFGKTMGFVHAKDSDDFQKTVMLKHPHAPGLNKEGSEATVRFDTSRAMAESDQPKPPQAAKPTPPQPAKPAAPQAARPTPPQPAKPAAPQAAKPTPPQPAKPAAASVQESGGINPLDLDDMLSLEELDQFLLPTADQEKAGGSERVSAKTASRPPETSGPTLAADELDLLDFSVLEKSLLDEADESLAAPAGTETGHEEVGFDWETSSTAALTATPRRSEISEDQDLLTALDELASETAELESDKLLESAMPTKSVAGDLPDLDLGTGDFTTSQDNGFLFGETTAPGSKKVMLTEEDELPETASDIEENEFLMVEEPAPAVTEESLSKESPFQTQYDENVEELAEAAAARVSKKPTVVEELEAEFTTTKPDILAETPAVAPAAVAKPAAKPRGSGFAVFLALLGIAAAGGVGWLTLQTMDRIDQLEVRIAALSGQGQPDAVNARQDQSIDSLKAKTADLEQQMDNLTGVVSDLATKNRNRNTRTKPTPAKPKPTPAQTAAPAAAVTTSAAASPAAETTANQWVINLTSLASESAAHDEVQRLKGLGVDAEAVRVEIDGKPWYRIRVGNFPSEEAAKARSDELAQQLGIQDAWVSHR